MRKTLLASALVLAMTASTYAGEMQYPIAPPPPPAAPMLIQITLTLLGLF